MSRIPAAVIAIAVLLAPAAQAVCPLNVRFSDDPPTLSWASIPGASAYEVQETFDNITSRSYYPQTTSLPIRRRSSSDVKVTYIVTAILPASILALGDASEACRESTMVTLKADPAFRALTRKAVIPIAGSGAGANGSRFKTSLKLTATLAGERGRLIFHPAGSVARGDDPSIRYRFDEGAGQELRFDDVVAALGASGVGSLDLVPDEGAPDMLPDVEARLYNDTTGGTFGTPAPALLPFDFLQPPVLSVTVPAGEAQFRINVGVRTLSETHAIALVYGVSGHLRDFHRLAWPADFTTLTTVEQFIGVPVATGESVSVFFEGSAIPFYTRTENRTNDPELMIPPRVRPVSVGSFVE